MSSASSFKVNGESCRGADSAELRAPGMVDFPAAARDVGQLLRVPERYKEIEVFQTPDVVVPIVPRTVASV